MATKKLAKQLGFLRQRSHSSSGSKKPLASQIFSYLIVMDFESTCWKEKNNYGQEIIEFPAVLLNTSSGEVESEFHAYVQPQEHPMLSEFCTELTGITQTQVEAGIPLQICLSRFARWLQNLQLEKGVVFPNRQQKPAEPSQKLCTFLTWSDWDLGVCLQYECKRKQLHKPDVLNCWIDLRGTYRLFYDRKPKGLNGALQDLGIQFSGREHSGLDDSRNTARLAARMMRDGCVMKITRSLERTPATIKPANKLSDKKTEKHHSTDNKENTLDTENHPSASNQMVPLKSGQIESLSSSQREKPGSVQGAVRSLISPKTLLNTNNASPWQRNRMSVTSGAIADPSASVTVTSYSPDGNKSLVLCSTTLGFLSDLPRRGAVERVEGEELVAETAERCGSYDDVVLGGGGGDPERVSEYDGGCCGPEESDGSDPAASSSALTGSIGNPDTRGAFVSAGKTGWGFSKAEACFAMPRTVLSYSKNELAQSLKFRRKSNSTASRTPDPLRHKPFALGNTSTPNNATFPKHRLDSALNRETPRPSFRIFTDPKRPRTSSGRPPDTALRPLSANTPASLIERSSSPFSTAKKGPTVTSPLCSCGRRAKRQVVSNGGPNQGRGFFCCPVRRSGGGGGGGQVQKGCKFFAWESAVMRRGSVGSRPPPAAAGASVSLCSTLDFQPQRRSMIRKSY